MRPSFSDEFKFQGLYVLQFHMVPEGSMNTIQCSDLVTVTHTETHPQVIAVCWTLEKSLRESMVQVNGMVFARYWSLA
jgi:hypothetical protein